MSSSKNSDDGKVNTSIHHNTKDKKDMSNNTAFHRKLKMDYGLKKWQDYPKYFC